MSQPLSISSENEEKKSEEDESNEEEDRSNNNSKNNDFKNEMIFYENNNDNNMVLNKEKKEINDNDNNKGKKQKLMVMVIPKINKDLPLPLNTLYFFLELFGYENSLKEVTDEDNKLVFYLLNINWLNELKTYYNYKCIEFIIKKN